MKFPSLNVLIQATGSTFMRFPLVLLCAITGSFTLILAVDKVKIDDFILINTGITSLLGISFTFAVALFLERYQPGRYFSVAVQSISVILLIICYSILPSRDYSIDVIIRLFVLSLVFHLLASFAPFVGINDKNGFWQYNKSVFIRILTSVLYSSVLFIGLTIALTSITVLFGMKIESETYSKLAIFIYGIFNTWFFLAGIPRDFQILHEEEDYPKGLKVFTQYVLLPLVVIYLAILYAYTGKIIIQWSLPKGWVSYLIICFSIAGIFSLLLIEPIKNLEQNRWIKIFTRWFYLALFPLILLLFAAIGTRVLEYGITELRYFILILACWLAGIAVYFLLSPIKSIKTIPVSLSIIALLSIIGPWNAFNVSLLSQRTIFKEILSKKALFDDKGFIKKYNGSLSREQEVQIASITSFFVKRNESLILKTYFSGIHDTVFTSDKMYNKEHLLLSSVGLPEETYYYGTNNKSDSLKTRRVSFSNYEGTFYEITGYDYFVEQTLSSDTDTITVWAGPKILKLKLDEEQNAIMCREGNSKVISVNVDDLVKKLYDVYDKNNYSSQGYYPASKDEMVLKTKDNSLKIYFKNIDTEKTGKEIKILSVVAVLMIKVKQE